MGSKNESLKLIVLDNMSEFGKQVNKHLKKLRNYRNDFLVSIDQVRFSNGEGKIVLKDSVRDKDVFILADVGNYNTYYKTFKYEHYMRPDEHFQDIKRTISAIRGNSDRITIIMPLLYESRQHSRNGRESLDCALALQELERMGVTNIVTFDAHDPNVQNAIPLLPFDNFFPTNAILEKFINDNEIDYDNLLVISPDEGAMKRSRYYAGMLESDIGMFYKRRDYSKVVDGKNPVVEHKYLGKEEEGLNYVVVDDMIASGGSIFDILNELEKKKANNIYVIATFALFTDGAQKFDEYYQKGILTKLYTTNLSYIPEDIKTKPWFCEVDCTKFMADIISTYHDRESVSGLLNGKKEMFSKIKAAKKAKVKKS